MKKGWIIGCVALSVLCVGLCTGVIGIFVYGIFSLTQPVVDASNEFLTLVGQGKIAEAYASTANEYRTNQDEESFAFAVKQHGLTKFASASWNNRHIKNGEGTTAGTATSTEGATTPVSMRLIQEDGKWKVASVQANGVELATVRAIPPLPADAELKTMTTETLLDFNSAVKAKDFAPFHDKVSALLKREMPPEKMRDAFQEFIDKKIDIAAIKNVAPTFDPLPTVSAKGELILAGRYPTQPLPVHFTLQYLRERGEWRLTAIRVNVGKK